MWNSSHNNDNSSSSNNNKCSNCQLPQPLGLTSSSCTFCGGSMEAVVAFPLTVPLPTAAAAAAGAASQSINLFVDPPTKARLSRNDSGINNDPSFSNRGRSLSCHDLSSMIAGFSPADSQGPSSTAAVAAIPTAVTPTFGDDDWLEDDTVPQEPYKKREVIDRSSDNEDDDRKVPANKKSKTTMGDLYLDELQAEMTLAQQIEERKQQEQNAMFLSNSGRAFKLVETFIQMHKDILEDETTGTCQNEIALVGQDDMVFLAERFLTCQQSFLRANKPTHASLAYHYTSERHLQSIRQDGLLSHPERQSNNIAARRTAYFGDGVYTACNPYAFRHFGNTGLLCAILKGNVAGVGQGGSQDPDVNTAVGNKRRAATSLTDEIVLKECCQVLPILRFSTSLVNASGSLIHNGNALLWKFHVQIQKILDQYFNANISTPVERVTPYNNMDLTPIPISFGVAPPPRPQPQPTTTLWNPAAQPNPLAAPGTATFQAATSQTQNPVATTMNQGIAQSPFAPTMNQAAAAATAQTAIQSTTSLTQTQLPPQSNATTNVQNQFSPGTHRHASLSPMVPLERNEMVRRDSVRGRRRGDAAKPNTGAKEDNWLRQLRDRARSHQNLSSKMTASTGLSGANTSHSHPTVAVKANAMSKEARTRSTQSTSAPTLTAHANPPIQTKILSYVAPVSLATADDCCRRVRTLSRLEDCPICFTKLHRKGRVFQLYACGHLFHSDCISAALKHDSKCPKCRTPVSKDPQGRSPSGTMTIAHTTSQCSGFADSNGSITLRYVFPSGTQLPYHESPGKPYSANRRSAYLPNNTDGRNLLKRFEYAWSKGLLFSVGTSLTTGKSGQVVWSSVHQKSSMSGGAHGFPDSNYLASVNADLDALGVPPHEKVNN